MTGTSRRPAGHPAVHRHQLGRDLRQLRQARSLRLEDAAARAGIAPSTLSRIENGQAPAKTRYLTILLDFYGVDNPADRARLLSTARDGQARPWWAGCGGLLPAGTGAYLHHEAAADGIAMHAPHVIPELAQTPDYAYACARLANPALTDTENSLVAAHQAVRAAHLRPGRRLHLIISETALRRPVAPPQVMTAQFSHLLDLAAQPTATVQITTTTAPVLSPPFTLLTYTDPATPPVTCYHGPAGQVILTRRTADTRTASATFTALTQTALPPEDSATLIRDLTQATQPGKPANSTST
jgi:transcriptional regulator with XRE-family HTH domain